MKKVLALLFSATMVGAVVPAGAQDKKPTTMVGIYLGPGFQFHSPDFAIPSSIGLLTDSDTPLGSINTGNTSVGFHAGLLLEHRLNNWFGLGLRLGYNGFGEAVLTGNDTSRTIDVYPRDESNIDVKAAVTEREITSTLNYIEIAPYVMFHDVFVDNLYVTLGPGIGIPAGTPQYGHRIRLTDPSPNDYFFTNKSSEIPTGDPRKIDVPDAALRLAADLGVGYNIQLSNSIWLAPEVKFSFPFTKVSSSAIFDKWTVPQLRASVALRFDISGSDEQKKPETTATDDLTVSMPEVVYYDETGNANTLRVLKVEDLQYSEMYPLVPYVFFDKGTATMKSQATMARESGDFSIDNLPQDAIEINNNALNIVGTRMKNYPQASLTIIGTNSGKDKSENRQVSQQRAEAVKNYLVGSVGVDASRITTEARDLPEKASNNTIPDGMEENRRVELRSNTPEVLDPIIIQKDKQRITTPSMVEFRPKVTSSSPITEWKLSISQAGKSLREFSRNGEVSPQRWIIRPNELSASQLPIEYTFTATDQSGSTKEVSGTIAVDYISSTRKSVEQLPDRMVEKFSLILFDFDKSEITSDNSRILDKVVLPAIKFNSIVKVYGYTDRTGEPDYNKKLSMQRADAVRSYLEGKVKAARYETAGVGEDLLLFENDMPAGRQLSRTVQVFIETPTK